MAKNKPRYNIAKMPDTEIHAEIAEIFRADAGILEPSKTIREIAWFRNILFYLGEQWIAWFTETNTFGARFKLNFNEPTPVSNIVRDYVRSMKALILNKKYATRVWPNSTEQKDKDAAELGVKVLKWLETLQCNEVEDIKELIALWTILTGNAFARTYANMDNGRYSIDAAGNVISQGDVTVENIIPFNITVPLLGDNLRSKRYVGIKSLKEKEWIEDTFKVVIGSGDDSHALLEYERQLMTLVAEVSPWKGRSLEGSQDSITSLDTSKLVLYKEIEYRPTQKYPRGRYITCAGGKIVINNPELPIAVTEDGEWDYTITDFKYNHTPGSFWATSGVDDLISPQKTINEIDRDLASNRKSIGRPYVLTPKDLIIKRKSQHGASFLQLEYDALLSGGAKPEVHNGTPYPQQILEERKINIGVAQDAAGDPKNILRGQSPHSGASGIMVDILRESAEMSHTPDIERFYRSWNRVKRKQLIVAKDLFTENRMIKVAGAGNEILIKAFKGADLYNNTDVRLEIDSGVSSTQAGQNEFVLNLVRNNFFGDVSQRPSMQYELMKRFGMSFIPIETSTHQGRASRENSMVANATADDIIVDKTLDNKPIPLLKGLFYSAPDPKSGNVIVMSHDPYFKYDDHKVHYDSHVLTILSNEFKSWPVGNQMTLINHCDMHHYSLQAIEQEQMKTQMQMAMAGQKPQAGQAQPTTATGEANAPPADISAGLPPGSEQGNQAQQTQSTGAEVGPLPVG